jgi:uroporphyrinogen decarboxylase
MEKPHKPDSKALVDNLSRKGTPKRVHHMELFHDGEIMAAIVERYDLLKGVVKADPWYGAKEQIAVTRFLGFDFLNTGLSGIDMPTKGLKTDDVGPLARAGGRDFMEEHKGPITNWEEFEKYPWPDVSKASTTQLEWYEKNAPDDMCLVVHTSHFAEYLAWLMGYETLCYALFDQRDLVQAIYDKVLALHVAEMKLILQFKRVRMIWGSDDMGFKTGLLISPADTREFILTGHKAIAKITHDAGRLYLLHSCGQLKDIIDDLADDVKIDAKHSFEDTIEDVRDAKKTYGRRMALIGGIDLGFLCKADEQAIRKRVRETLDACQPGGGYCLGTGNSVANYVPLENYFAMVDEGWRYVG